MGPPPSAQIYRTDITNRHRDTTDRRTCRVDPCGATDARAAGRTGAGRSLRPGPVRPRAPRPPCAGAVRRPRSHREVVLVVLRWSGPPAEASIAIANRIVWRNSSVVGISPSSRRAGRAVARAPRAALEKGSPRAPARTARRCGSSSIAERARASTRPSTVVATTQTSAAAATVFHAGPRASRAVHGVPTRAWIVGTRGAPPHRSRDVTISASSRISRPRRGRTPALG